MKRGSSRADERRHFVTETALALGLVAGLPVGVAEATERPAAEQRLEPMFEGRTGQWLADAHLEVFVQAEPFPRVMALRRPGGENLLLSVNPKFKYDGIRTWYMEPYQTKLAPGPSEQPAEIEPLGENHVRLVARPDEKSGLQNVMEIRLDGEKPVLHLRHGVKNVSEETRRIASWSIAAIPGVGRILVPVMSDVPEIESFTYFFYTNPQQPIYRRVNNALEVSLEESLQFGAKTSKIGVENRLGTALWDRPGVLLKSHAGYEADGNYPEGGANMTFYYGRQNDAAYGEIEHVGPLKDVPPGHTLWLEQSITLQEPADLPDDPREALLQALPAYAEAVAPKKK
ncbi:MAG: hypothetical protein ACFCVE_15260 [Phycisphaerae bacterium]